MVFLLLSISPIAVFAQSSLNVLQERVSIDIDQGETKTTTIQIQNTGSTDIELEFDTSQLDLTDNDGDTITIGFSDPGIIPPNETRNVTITISTETLSDLEEYGGSVIVKDKLSTAQDTFNLEIDVEINLCSGSVGSDLSIDIVEPDRGDDFEPGDNIMIDVDVSNDGLNDIRTQVEAFLVSENEVIEDTSSITKNIENGEDEDFELDLLIPIDSKDIDEDEDFKLAIRAFDDDNINLNCAQEFIDVNIELPSKKVIVDEENSAVVPEFLSCGETATATVRVINIGRSSADGTISIRNSELEISETSDSFELDEFGAEEENQATRQFIFEIPDNAKRKKYALEVRSNFDAQIDTFSIPFEIARCEGREIFPTIGKKPVLINVLEPRFIVEQNTLRTFPVEITNNQNKRAIYTITLENIDEFAHTTSKTTLLNPGQRGTVFMDLLVKEDVSPGIYSGTVEVKLDQITVASESIAVEVLEKEEKLSIVQALQNLPLGFWIVLNIILLLLLILSLKIVIFPAKINKGLRYRR